MVFQYVILFNSDRELATTIHEASYLLKFDPMNVMGCISIFPLNNTFGKDSLYQIFIDLGFATIFYLVGGICYKKRKVYY